MKGENLLIKYVKEGLNNEERFELEKLALSDDFLAEAWEGLSGPQSQNVIDVLNRIHNRIDKKKSTRIVPIYLKLWPYAVAASLIIVFTFAFLLKQTNNSNVSSIVMDSDQSETNQEVAMEVREQQEKNDPISQVISVEKRTESTLKNTQPKINKLPVVNNKATVKEEEIELSNSQNKQKADPLIITSETSNPSTILHNDIISRDELTTTATSEMGVLKDDVINDQAFEPNRDLIGANKESKLELLDTENRKLIAQSKKFNISPKSASPVAVESIMPISAQARVIADTINFYPIIGFEEFRIMMSKETDILKDEFFMQGIQTPFIAKMNFNIGHDGFPVNIDITNLRVGSLKQKIINLFKKGGAWKSKEEMIYYDFAVPLKNN